RNAAFAAMLAGHGVGAADGDGLNVWVELPVPARAVTEQLMRRGWLARPGDEFVLDDADGAKHLRLTVHNLSDADARRLASDLAAAIAAVELKKAG
ncbi:MAG: transcriptional regulator PtsJ, partial [Microbacterium sp.]